MTALNTKFHTGFNTKVLPGRFSKNLALIKKVASRPFYGVLFSCSTTLIASSTSPPNHLLSNAPPSFSHTLSSAFTSCMCTLQPHNIWSCACPLGESKHSSHSVFLLLHKFLPIHSGTWVIPLSSIMGYIAKPCLPSGRPPPLLFYHPAFSLLPLPI